MSPFSGRNPVFVFHLVAAGLTASLFITQLTGLFLSPVDLFVHAHAVLLGYLQYALAVLVFYGFSLVLLRLVPLPRRWGVPYVLLSWLFSLWAFFPSRAGTGGMMRRIAGSYEDYLAAQRLGEWLHLVAVLVFALVQLAYLSYVVRRLRSSAATPNA